MEQTLDIALANAAGQGASKIHCFKMRIGDMSGVVPEALNFSFDIVTAGTIAQGAKLEIETVPIVCHCPNCSQEFEPPDFVYECPNCGHISNQIISGREIELTSLEVS